MADSLTSIANKSIRYDTAPITEPPRTVFPYPQSERSFEPSSRERDGSDATLAEPAHDEELRSAGYLAVSMHERPTLADKKFDTEAPKTVGSRPVVTPNARRWTSGHPHDREFPFRRQDNSYSSSDSDSSTDDDAPRSPSRSTDSLPEHGDLQTKELNRARMRPRNGTKRRNVTVGNEHFQTQGRLAKDGRLNVKISEMANTGYLAKALGSALSGHLRSHAKEAQQEADDRKKRYDENKHTITIPRMNIVIMVIGSRGDVQPFMKIGQVLRDQYGHRVRIATHPAFRKFVQDEMGLEHFSIGGDPSELMSFMVRNPGLIPSLETLTSGEVGRRREQMFEMFNGFWRACINTTDNEKDTTNLKLTGDKQPFIADAIIANPVSFAHYHCAERLGIPLHLVFTFPYTPTTAFPHPLANIKASNVDREYTNYMSYPLVDLMTWQGLGDLVNRFRVKTLGLEPVSTLWAPGQLTRMRVPITYLWSPSLVPKPQDWGPEVDIAGYVFLDLAKSYKPPKDLTDFLKRSEDDTRPIIYIGFGSIAGIKDATAFCNLIFKATVEAGVRAVVSRGWGGMGDGMDIPDGVHMVDNVPHDWLFPQLDACVHHGGAGTTAIGLKLGLPTMIVPFFGDQPFWADMIARSGAGAKQVWPLKKLTVERFATSIKDCLEPSAKENAQEIAKSIVAEGDGAENAVDSFHRNLALFGEHSVRCGVFADRIAVWEVQHTHLKLSALAAYLLVESKQISWDDMELLRHKKWADFSGPGEPLTGAGGVVVGAFQEALHGVSEVKDKTKADWRRIAKHKRKKKVATVAEAITLPAKIAQSARATQDDHKDKEGGETKVNLTGKAEPIRRPGIAAVIGNDGVDRPGATRTDTASTLGGRPAPLILAEDVGKGVGRSLKAIVLLPSDMLNAVTLGFRNAPRLYGDKTVRPAPQNIKGFRQGARVAGKELFFGIYDGATGLVRLPYLDVKEEGLSALPVGVVRGVGGVVLKPIAGTLGLFNYTNRGVFASIRKRFRDTEKTERWIRRIRLAQGAIEVQELRAREQKQLETRNKGSDSARGGELEQARTRVLTRFTSYDRREIEEAREKEKRGSIILPKLTKSEPSRK